MTISHDLDLEIKSITISSWDIKAGQVVPTSESLGLYNDGRELQATIIYADLADSTKLALIYEPWKVAEIYKAFLICSSRIIKYHTGEIRSFDGDRVMGIFIGTSKNSNAARCALHISYAFHRILLPQFTQSYGEMPLSYGVGVDTSSVLAVRGGVRNDNDLIWIGRAPNIAAKLCGIRHPGFNTFVTSNVFEVLSEDARLYNRQSMWTKFSYDDIPGIDTVYASSWWRIYE